MMYEGKDIDKLLFDFEERMKKKREAEEEEERKRAEKLSQEYLKRTGRNG